MQQDVEIHIMRFENVLNVDKYNLHSRVKLYGYKLSKKKWQLHFCP
jgi:hypothetical protein